MSARADKTAIGREVLLLLELLNGDLSIEDGWEDWRATEVATASARERILALIKAIRDIEADVNDALPTDYPRERSSAYGAKSASELFAREIVVMKAEREGKPPPPNWPRPALAPIPLGMSGTPICWGEANAILADYSITRRIRRLFPDLGGEEWAVEEEDSGERPRVEFRIVNEVLRLAERAQLDRIRTCECGKWFYATRKNQRSHESRCRKQRHAKSEKFKAHRRLYMRWYYAMYESPRAPRKKLTFDQWSKRSNERKGGNRR
jgi:hypothetical protein